MTFDDVPDAAKQIVLRASIQRLLDEAKGIDTGILFPYVTLSEDGIPYEREMIYDLWLRMDEKPPIPFYRGRGIPPVSDLPEGSCRRGERDPASVVFIRQPLEKFAALLASPEWYPDELNEIEPRDPLIAALHFAADGTILRLGYDPGTRSYIPSPLEGDPIDGFLDLVELTEGNRDWLIFKYADPTQGMCDAMQWPTILKQESYSKALINLSTRLGRIHLEGDRLHQPTDKLKPIIEAAKSELTGCMSLSGEARRRAGRAALVRLHDEFSVFGFQRKGGGIQTHYRHYDRWWQEFYRIAADMDGPDEALAAVKTWLLELGVKDRWPEIQSKPVTRPDTSDG